MHERGYIAIPPAAIIAGVLPEFKIYILSPQGRYILWALKGEEVTPEQLGRLSEHGSKEVFVDLEEKFKYEEYLENNLGKVLENDKLPDNQKADIVVQISTNVVKTAFETSLGLSSISADAMERTQRLVKNALQFIAESKSLHALAKIIGHDYQTYQHATKVLWLTAVFLRNNPEVLEQIEPDFPAVDDHEETSILQQCGVGALLHDIGKAFIAQEILNKTAPLDETEWEIMKRHPLIGLAMLLDTDIPVFVKKAVLHHHEDYHGGGYPMGLQGPSINILARLIRIADAFDAMTSRRPYKDPMSPMEAMRIMIGQPALKEGEDPSGQDERDQGMKRCFDEGLLRKFIVFLGNVNLNS